jgi:hypothetical protein
VSVTRVNSSSISASGTTASAFGVALGVACNVGDVIVVTADCNGTHAANGMSVQETTNAQNFTTISETQQGGASSRWVQTFMLKTTVALTGAETIQLTPYAANTQATFVVDVYRGLSGLISRAAQITSGAAGLTATNPALLSAPPVGDLVLSLTGVSSGTATKPTAYALASQTTVGPTTSNAHVLSADGTSTYGGTWTWGTSNSSALQTLALQSTAPVFESRTNLVGANGASAVITYPASIAAGDILLVHIYKENTAAVTPPDGTWTLKGSTTTTAPQHHLVFWKRAAGGETGTVTFSWTGSVFRATTCERYSNCAATGDPIEAITFNQTNSSVTTLNVSLASTSPDSMLIWSGTSFTGGNTWTTPTGYGNLANLDVLGAANKRNPVGGATGNVTGTANISGPMTSALLSLLGTSVVATPAADPSPNPIWVPAFMLGVGALPGPLTRIASPLSPAMLPTDVGVTSGGPKVIAVGTVVETDIALTLGITKGVNTVVETDIAGTISESKARAVGTVVETDVAVQLSIKKGVNTVVETDLALPITKPPKVRAVGTVTETDTAGTLGRIKTRAVGTVVETDTAIALSRKKTKTVGIVTETDIAIAVTAKKTKLVGIVTEVDTAVVLSRSKARTVGIVTETDTAIAFGKKKVKAVGIVTEVDNALTIVKPLKGANTVTETDLALPLGKRKTKAVGVVTEVDLAIALTRTHRKSITFAIETDSAIAIGKRKARTVGVASETDLAQPFGKSKRTLVGTVIEIDLAQPVFRPPTILEGMRIVITGVGTSSRNPKGPALRRVGTGVVVRLVNTGVGAPKTLVGNVGVHAQAVTGPAVRRVVTGPAVEGVKGVGI